MITVYLIVSALTATVLTKGSIECNFGDSSGTRQCHGAEGQRLIFHLSNETNTELKLVKDEKYRIFKKTKNGTVTLDETYVVSQFDQKGKLNLGQATKRHSGKYLLEEYECDDGKIIKKVEMILTIHAQVSRPTISQVCFSPELMSVTCSSKGDRTDICMTVDDNISINLVCQVWKDYSRNETVFHLMTCKGTVLILVLACVGTVFALVALGLVFKLYKIKKHTPVNDGDNEEEIIYSDVKLRQTQRPQSSSQENAN